jgi:ribosomal protein S18 acetylase RimI-like enzyme
MQKVEESLTQMGCPKLNLQIRADNVEVQAFYESLGYEVEQRISMGKELSPGIGQSRIAGDQSD